MNHRLTARRRGLVTVFCSVALLTMASLAQASTYSFGARKIEIPAPEQSKPIATAYPKLFDVSASFMPPENRLVESYITPEQFIELALGEHHELTHYYQLQVMRKLEGVPVPAAVFDQGRASIRAGLQKAFGSIQGLANGLMKQGNEHVHELTGKDVNVSMSGTGYLGEFRQEPWGVFFSMRSSVAAMGNAPTPMVLSGAIVCIDGQMLYLYAYSRYTGKKDIQWTEHAISTWADAIRAANHA